MKPEKNETSFKTEPIVHESSLNGNFVVELSGAHLQQIKKAPYLQYDFAPIGLLQVILPNGERLGFNTDALSHDVVETLVAACLNDKTVVGYDLYTSYTLSYCVTEDWMPNCSLNIPSLKRIFRASKPLVEGLAGIPQLMSMTDTKSFGEAMERIFDWDERSGNYFFAACELMPYAMTSICAQAVHGMEFDGSGRLAFESLLRNDFVRRRSSLMSPTRQELLQFDLRFLPEVHREYQLAADSVCNALTRAEAARSE